MRRSALGLAAAVIAGAVGFAGAAKALPAYKLLGTVGNTLTDSSGNTWNVQSCSFGGTGGCNNFVMFNDGNGIGVAGAPGTGSGVLGAEGLPTLGSEIQTVSGTTYQDVTVHLYEYTGATFFSGSATIGTANLTSSGPTRGGASLVSAYSTSSSHISYTIGLSGSGYSSSVSFTPVNTVSYQMDIPFEGTTSFVTFGTPVPEPPSLGVLAAAVIVMASARYRKARRAS